MQHFACLIYKKETCILPSWQHNETSERICEISASILSIPCGVLYIPIPVSCILMMIQYWINTKKELKDLDKNTNEKMDKNINKNTNKNINIKEEA